MGGRGGYKGGARPSPKMWPVSWTQTFIKCGGLFLQVDRIEGVSCQRMERRWEKGFGANSCGIGSVCGTHPYIILKWVCALAALCSRNANGQLVEQSVCGHCRVFFIEIFTQASKRAMFILSMRGTAQSHCELPRYFDASRHMFLSAPTDDPPRSPTPRDARYKKK